MQDVATGFNNSLLKLLDTNSAIFFLNLYIESGFTTDWLNSTEDEIHQVTDLSSRVQKRCIKTLISKRFIRHKTNGNDINHLFQVNFCKFHNIMLSLDKNLDCVLLSKERRPTPETAREQAKQLKLCFFSLLSKERRHTYGGVLEHKKEKFVTKRTIPAVSRDELIEYWNKTPGVPRHPNPNTNAYKNCIKIFKDMMTGKFITKRPRLKTFIKDQHLPHHLIEKTWTKEELYAMLDKLIVLCRKNTKIKTRSLVHLLFCPLHPTKMYSMFLIVADETRFKHMTGGEILADSTPHLTEEFNELLEFDFKSASNLIVLINYITALKEFYRSLPAEVFKDRHDETWSPHISFTCPNEEKFVLHYLKYLTRRDWHHLRKPVVGIVNPKSKTFRGYLEECWDKDTNAARKGLVSFL